MYRIANQGYVAKVLSGSVMGTVGWYSEKSSGGTLAESGPSRENTSRP